MYMPIRTTFILQSSVCLPFVVWGGSGSAGRWARRDVGFGMRRLPDVGLRPTVPDLLRHGSERYADQDLVVLKDRRLGFGQADEYSAALAKRLLAAGVGKGSRVGIVLPSSTQFVVAFLAAARIGAVAVLFSTLYRPVELPANPASLRRRTLDRAGDSFRTGLRGSGRRDGSGIGVGCAAVPTSDGAVSSVGMA